MILGFGLSTLISVILAVHAVRTGQNMYWLFILFIFPWLGAAVYFFAILLPQSRLPRDLKVAGSVTARALDPGRELREARDAVQMTPTAQNQLRLARALQASGDLAGALAQYEQCLSGPLGHDPEIRLTAARARLANRQPREAQAMLESIRSEQPDFRVEEVTLALARACAAQGLNDAARAQFEFAATRFGSFEARVDYAVWAHAQGDTATAERLRADLNDTMRHWNRHTRELNRELIARLNAGFSSART